VKLEAVSPRLRRALIHPNRTAVLVGLRFAPDGKRIVAGDYPGGVIQVWDADSGKQLTRIETGHGYRGSGEYLFLCPHCKTVYVSREKRNRARVQKDGKRLIRWEPTGDVRAWDLDTGKLRATFEHRPARGISAMLLSPDGRTLVTFEELPGESAGPPEQAATLWDVRTKQKRSLAGEPQYWAVFSPDGKTLASPGQTKEGRLTVQLVEVATGHQKRTIQIDKNARRVGYIAFAPDGKLLAGQVRGPKDHGDCLKFWDPATGRELASFAGEKNNLFLFMAFSPDGQTLAVTNGRRQQGKLFLFDVPGKKLARTVLLRENGSLAPPVFSPDGKWLAVAAQVVPNDRSGGDPTPEDLPQPRIHLIEPASGAVRETIVCPQAFTRSLCFSPDGKTLASGGNGRVLLWDLAKSPIGARTDRTK
jgi:WD40 repeat protein